MGEFRMYDTGNEMVRVISFGDLLEIGNNPLVRIQSSCLASEVFGAKDCDCADQLCESMKMIATEGAGLILHLHQEGRGQGLSNKITAVRKMQVEKIDTAESFKRMGLDQDIRSYDDAIKLLYHYGITKLRLISNNPRKRKALEIAGIAVETVNTNPKIRPENKEYLQSKNNKLGHQLPLDNNEDYNLPIHFYHSDQMWGEFSNFSAHPIFLKNTIWPTVEHYYQAQKFAGSDLELEIQLVDSPMQAKEKAVINRGKYDNDKWQAVKENIMLEALQAKFSQHPQLRERLISTKSRHIAEHTKNDLYWGDGCDDSGLNRLGKLLMQVRADLVTQ